MRRLRLLGLSGVAFLACGVANAQQTPDPRASRTPRSGPGYTNGWALMTQDERNEYKARMKAMTNAYACRDFVADHHRKMVERAKETAAGIPPPPRLDVCDGLPQ